MPFPLNHCITKVSYAALCQLMLLSATGLAQEDRATTEAAVSPSYASDIARYEQVNSFESLAELAKENATVSFEPMPPLPKVLDDLSYLKYSKIQFKYTEGVWWGGKIPFWFETFHRGFVQRGKVEIFTLIDGKSENVPYDRELFDYHGVLDPDEIPADTGHAGLKIAGRFPRFGDGEELLTFVGSSYFRARPDKFIYGASARALAVNIGMNEPEEFPVLRAFWVKQPKPHTDEVTVLGLLDSPRVTGAYEFTLHPGIFETQVEVKGRLFFRAPVEKLAFGPITTMWMWGDGYTGPEDDNRPAVHDSDGILMHSTDDGWIWRPLTRHAYPSVSFRKFKSLEGFGAMQRNNAFFHFEDYNANYHKRPSVFVKPKEPWENGRIELMEFPSHHEGIDNIGVYWVFDEAIDFDQPFDIDYTVSFLVGDIGDQNDVARATTFSVKRLESAVHEDEKEDDGGNDSDAIAANDEAAANNEGTASEDPDVAATKQIEISVRFSGEALDHYTHNTMPVMDLKVVNGRSLSQSVSRSETKDLIATTVIEPDGDAPIGLEFVLIHDGKKLTETFTYLCPVEKPVIPPDPDGEDDESEEEEVSGDEQE